MERKSAKELIKLIIASVSSSPKSIQEIAENCNSNWDSVRVYLESLKDAGIVQESAIGNKRVFSMGTRIVPENPNTYFGLPIKEEDEKTINSIFSVVKKEWTKITGNEPGRTQVQKCLARVNKECELGLPLGWYLHGPVCVDAYTPGNAYQYSGLNQNIERCIHNVVKDYSTENTAYSLKMRYYREEKNQLYNSKELMFQLLSSTVFSKSNIKEANSLLMEIIRNLPPIFDDDTNKMINQFQEMFIELLSRLTEEELSEIKIDVCTTFNEIWKLIAIFNYFNDLAPYYIRNYSREAELQHFLPEMNMQKMIVLECLRNLSDYMPAKNENVDENYRKFKNMLEG
jgi:predicted transcriptional regulator